MLEVTHFQEIVLIGPGPVTFSWVEAAGSIELVIAIVQMTQRSCKKNSQ